VRVNYTRVHFWGSLVVANVVVLLPTLLLYETTGTKIGSLLFFLPALIVVTRVLLWTQERVFKEDSDTLRRRYKAGHIPIGKDN
jgi:hypothetical protein